MAELIQNKESMRLVRAKLNATLRPYADRPEFEGSRVPVEVPLVHVIVGADVFRLTRDPVGDWVSADGARWTARILATAEDVAADRAAAELAAAQAAGFAATVQAAVIGLLVVVNNAADIPVPPAPGVLYVVRAS